MKIYTSYFKIRAQIEPEIVQISIASKSPVNFEGYELNTLKPYINWLNEYRITRNADKLMEHYWNRLKSLNANAVLSEIKYLSDGKDAVLLSWEKPDKFSLRYIVADWFKETLGIEINEYKIKNVQEVLFG